jgi:hypothetical protein
MNSGGLHVGFDLPPKLQTQSSKCRNQGILRVRSFIPFCRSEWRPLYEAPRLDEALHAGKAGEPARHKFRRLLDVHQAASRHYSRGGYIQ